MKRFVAILLAMLLACSLAACDPADTPEVSNIPARDNTDFSVEDVDLSKLPTAFKGMHDWTPEDHFVLLGQDTAKDLALYGLLKTKEGGAVEGDVGILLRDGEHLQLFKWSYFAESAMQPYVVFDDLDGDGATEIAISLHTAGVHTLNVLEKDAAGEWDRNQLTPTRIEEIIARDVDIAMADDRKTATWSVKGLEDKVFQATEYYTRYDLPYDAEKTVFAADAENMLGKQVEVHKCDDGGYELYYYTFYYVNNGTSNSLSQFDTLAAKISYAADGTFELSDYRFLS